MGEQGLRKTQIVQELVRSSHGNLGDYRKVAWKATGEDPDFMAHLIAWNHSNGQIRDSKVALPVSFVQIHKDHDELRENALAALASLDPRNLVRACRFSKEKKGGSRAIREVVERYLRAREENWAWWERTALQHRASLKTLYAFNHIRPHTMAEMILFKRLKPKGTVFHDLAMLKDLTPTAAAGTIMKRRIPFLIAFGALGDKAKHPDLLLALIGSMSPTELTTNAKLLGKMGVDSNPALRAAFEEGLTKAAKSKKTTLKAGRAAEAITDRKLKKKMEALQEKQIDSLKGVEGDWLVLGDRSGSMSLCIQAAREVAATLARFVTGQVWLVFFNDTPHATDVSGMPLSVIKEKTKRVTANGSTSIGCGLQWALDKNLNVDGIAVVSDMHENTYPALADVYVEYAKKFDKRPTLYLYEVGGHMGYTYGWNTSFEARLKAAGIDAQKFDLGNKVDYYSLPNLVQTMRSNRYSLVEEIMETPLLRMEDVLKKKGRAA